MKKTRLLSSFILHPSSFILLNSPEELKLLDPACGSGHILTYAFDLLYAIYEEQGYAATDIPKLILEKNIFGIEIDPRAGALAAFALTMKARAKDRRFFTRTTSPNICVLENVSFTDAELQPYMRALGLDLFTEPLRQTLRQFEQASNFGALIRPMLTDAAYVRDLLAAKNLGGDLFLYNVHERVMKVLQQAEFLAPRYHVVVANPPYMGGRNVNADLRDFAKDYFPDSQTDLFAMFIERILELVVQAGYAGLITMQSWMFLSSYEQLRKKVLQDKLIISMLHLGAKGFDSIGGEIVSTTAFVLQSTDSRDIPGIYFRLVEGNNETEKIRMLVEGIASRKSATSLNCYTVNAKDFMKMPGSPIAYWVSPAVNEIFFKSQSFSECSTTKQGLATGDNQQFLRLWYELSINKINFDCISNIDAINSLAKWVPYSKGGGFRKWYGFHEYVVFWEKGGEKIRNFTDTQGKELSRFRGADYYFKEAINWGLITTDKFSARYREQGFVFDIASMSAFDGDIYYNLGFLNSASTPD